LNNFGNEQSVLKIMEKQKRMFFLKEFLLGVLLLCSIDVHASWGNAPLHDLYAKYSKDKSGANKKTLTTAINEATKDDLNKKDKENKKTLLHKAAFEEHTDIVKALINAGAMLDVEDDKGNTPLHLAAMCGRTKIVEELTSANIDLIEEKNKNGATSLHLAAAGGHGDVFELLLRKNAKLGEKDNGGNTPLHLLAEGSSLTLLCSLKKISPKKILVDALNKKNGDGKTPLHVVVGTNDPLKRFVLDALLNEKGCNVNLADKKGNTPLHTALEGGGTFVAEALLAKGANPNLKNNAGNTPLHVAAQMGYQTVAKKLLCKGANPNPENNQNETPLHIAARNGEQCVVEELINANADINAKDREGKTPSDLAKTTEMKNILLQLPEQPATVTPTEEKPVKKLDLLEFLKEHKWGATGVALVAVSAIGVAVYLICRKLKIKRKIAALVKQLQAYHQTESPEEYNRLKNEILQGVDPAIAKQVEQSVKQPFSVFDHAF
jgi:ankyrin repeat protein